MNTPHYPMTEHYFHILIILNEKSKSRKSSSFTEIFFPYQKYCTRPVSSPKTLPQETLPWEMGLNWGGRHKTGEGPAWAGVEEQGGSSEPCGRAWDGDGGWLGARTGPWD